MSESQERARVIQIAKSCLGTPYKNCSMIKGKGLDCLTLLAVVYQEAGLISNVKIPHYSPDFMKHRGTELYLQGLLGYTHEVEKALPGDIALWKFGRCFSHAAIVVEWPVIIHAHISRNCMMEDIEKAQWLNLIGREKRPVKYFSYWKKNNEFYPRNIGDRS